MLRRLKQLYGNKLTATDGEIGVVKDLYFDERNWTVRYVVAETGTWLTSRQVLLSPHAFADGQRSEKKLSVNLSRQQIAGSPALEWHQPVSRQFEEAYHRYYGWPNYWEDDCLRNFPGLETIGQAPKVAPKKTLPTGSPREMTGAHLRSTQAMKRYQLQAGGGIIGQVGDFLMESRSWMIQKLVAQIGYRFCDHEIELPTTAVERIGWDSSAVFTRLTRKQVEQSLLPHLIFNGAATAPARVLSF